MSTDEPMPAEREAAVTSPDVEPAYAAEAEAMESLASAGYQVVHQSGPQDAPETLTYIRSDGANTDFVYLALNEGTYSTAVRYPMAVTARSFAEASGEEVPPALAHAKPGPIVDVIREVLEWPRG